MRGQGVAWESRGRAVRTARGAGQVCGVVGAAASRQAHRASRLGVARCVLVALLTFSYPPLIAPLLEMSWRAARLAAAAASRSDIGEACERRDGTGGWPKKRQLRPTKAVA
jgi:hypothetical protein